MRISDWSSDVCSSDLRNRYARADAVARIAAQIVARIVGAEQRGQPAELALKLGASAVALAALQFLAGTDIPCIAVAVRLLACDAQRHVCGERRVDDGLGTNGEIGRAHVCTPVTNAHLVCRLLLEK